MFGNVIENWGQERTRGWYIKRHQFASNEVAQCWKQRRSKLTNDESYLGPENMTGQQQPKCCNLLSLWVFRMGSLIRWWKSQENERKPIKWSHGVKLGQTKPKSGSSKKEKHGKEIVGGWDNHTLIWGWHVQQTCQRLEVCVTELGSDSCTMVVVRRQLWWFLEKRGLEGGEWNHGGCLNRTHKQHHMNWVFNHTCKFFIYDHSKHNIGKPNNGY